MVNAMEFNVTAQEKEFREAREEDCSVTFKDFSQLFIQNSVFRMTFIFL